MTVEIVLLALVALFVGLRLYAVLGRRAGHEQQPVTRPETVAGVESAPAQAEPTADRRDAPGLNFESGAAPGIRAITSADPSFDVGRFLEGAQAAHRMILEAFWRGDEAELESLVGEEVRASFAQAIAERKAAGFTLDNRLVRIDRAIIEEADLAGRTASIMVRFDSDIAAITRDADGAVVAGSLTDAIDTHERWTFRRDLSSSDPNWLLVETEDAD